MKRKIVVLALAIVVIALAIYAGVRYANRPIENEGMNQTDGATAETKLPHSLDDIVEISISEVEKAAEQNQKGLTQQEAEMLCREVLGEQAEENGFPISYQCIGAVSVRDRLYYVMHIAWLVDNHHWSYIGNCYVSFDGQEIYDGVVLPDGYEITELRWKA